MKKFELTIPKPCHENWDAMTPEEKGRFCGACQKTVIDFSNMTDHQMAQFFKKPVGDVCGRFHHDQLDRTIEMPKKRIPWLKYFFTISLPAFLISLKGSAQKEMVGKVAVVRTDTLPDSTRHHQEPGKIKQPLKGRVFIKKPERLQVEEIKTNASLFPKASVYALSSKIVVEEKKLPDLSLLTGTLGMVEVNWPARIKNKKLPNLVPVKKMDATMINFSVYPNPVSANASISIQPNNMEEGIYEWNIITSSGETVQRGEITLWSNTKSLALKLNAVPAGPYFMQLTNKKSKKVFSEILIVQ